MLYAEHHAKRAIFRGALVKETESQMIYEMRRLIYGNWQTCVTYAFAELNIGHLEN